MDWLAILFILVDIVVLVQCVRLVLADSDLTLQWAEKFGKPASSLRGKVVWITGASSGIGEYLAYELAAAGCKLVLSARRQEELERVKKQCLVSGPVKDEDVLVVPLDSLQFSTHQSAVDTVITHFTQIDVLVNNAGRSQRALWHEISLDVDQQMLNLNVLGVISLSKAVLPHMMKRESGHIVVMSSGAGKFGAPNSGSYTGAKHALHGFFEVLRIEGYEKNVCVTMVCPGPVFSGLLEAAMTGTPGETYGKKMQTNEKRMSTSRCAALITIAIANQLDEVWISLHPILFFFYISQYMPSMARNDISVPIKAEGTAVGLNWHGDLKDHQHNTTTVKLFSHYMVYKGL